MRGRSTWALLVPVAFACAGVLFVASATTARGTDLRGGEREDLADLVREQAEEVSRQASRLTERRAKVEQLRTTAAESDSRVAAALRRVEEQEAAAHLQAVEGPGVRVTLSDAPPTDPASLPEGFTVDALVVHQQDLQAVVNALWAGGAEAVQLMDQRVISTSAVRCVGNVLILQGRTYSPPYTVTAVGDVAGMQAALHASHGVQDYLYYADIVGLGYEEEELESVTLPAYEGALDLSFASVPEVGSPGPPGTAEPADLADGSAG